MGLAPCLSSHLCLLHGGHPCDYSWLHTASIRAGRRNSRSLRIEFLPTEQEREEEPGNHSLPCWSQERFVAGVQEESIYRSSRLSHFPSFALMCLRPLPFSPSLGERSFYFLVKGSHRPPPTPPRQSNLFLDCFP